MRKFIRKVWHCCKAKQIAKEIERLRDEFYIKEKNGTVWILHNGIAIEKIHPLSSSEDMLKLLENARRNAVSYAFGITTAEETEGGVLMSIAKELAGLEELED